MVDLPTPPGSNLSGEDSRSYRVVAMLPTEMYIDADDLESAEIAASYYIDGYPTVSYPMAVTADIEGNAGAKVLSVEEAPE